MSAMVINGVDDRADTAYSPTRVGMSAMTPVRGDNCVALERWLCWPRSMADCWLARISDDLMLVCASFTAMRCWFARSVASLTAMFCASRLALAVSRAILAVS